MNKQLLKEILSLQSVSGNEQAVNSWVKSWCKKNGIKFKNVDGNLYLQKGKASLYPCYVAHTDTVHSIVKNCITLSIVEFNGKLIALDGDYEQVGIGGDDKVGIYIALQMLTKLPACKVALFYSEEIGCVGSNLADVKFFEDCAWVLQADRRGNSDFVTSIGSMSISSKDFRKTVKDITKKYGYKFSSGAMTDVQALVRKGVGISCANVSCGYYNPHSSGEYVDIADVSNTEKMFFEIGRKMCDKRYVNTYEAPVYNTDWSKHSYYKGYGSYGHYYDTLDYNTFDSGIDSFGKVSDDKGINMSNGWKYYTLYGWMRKTKDKHCKKCYENVSERDNTSYFKYVCTECQTMHMDDEVLSYEDVMAILLSDTATKEPIKRNKIDRKQYSLTLK